MTVRLKYIQSFEECKQLVRFTGLKFMKKPSKNTVPLLILPYGTILGFIVYEDRSSGRVGTLHWRHQHATPWWFFYKSSAVYVAVDSCWVMKAIKCSVLYEIDTEYFRKQGSRGSLLIPKASKLPAHFQHEIREAF